MTGCMDIGLRSISRAWLAVALLLLLAGCGHTSAQIARQQSLVTELSVQCESGDDGACDRLKIEEDRLTEWLR